MCALQRLSPFLYKLTPEQGFLVKLLSSLALYMVLCILVPAQVDAEEIRSFQSEIRIQSDSSIKVQETFVYDPQESPPRSVYRIFPLRNQTVGGASPRCVVKMNSVTDQFGNPISFSEARLGDNLSVRLGRPKGAQQGEPVSYIITYSAWHTFRYLNGTAEFCWNATGSSWPVELKNVTVNVWFPDNGQSNRPLGVECYVESPDGTRKGTQLINTSAVTLTTDTVGAGESFSVLIGFPENMVRHESLLDKVDLWLDDWWLAVLLPVMCATGLGIVWWYSGRDALVPRADSEVAATAKNDGGSSQPLMPPGLLTPAELGTIIDEQCDIEDVMSTLIDLAVRGVLKIKETDGGGNSSAVHDYEFVKLSSPDSGRLAPHEEKLLELLFPTNEVQPKLSELRLRFFARLNPITDAIYQNLTNGGYFRGNPKNIRNSYCVLGASLGFFGITVAIVFPQFIATSIGLILCGLITFSAAGAMPARTAQGTRARKSILEFKQRLKSISSAELNTLAEADPAIFERLLPHALVLGAVDQWSEKCLAITPGNIAWYEFESLPESQPSQRIVQLGRGLRNIASVFNTQNRAVTRLKEVAEALGGQV